MHRPATVSLRRPAGPTLGRVPAFWLLAVILGLLLFASSAPSPLYIVYAAQFHFSSITLTSVFAVYALGLLASLVIAGSVSDHVGRRPTLLVALAIETAGMLLFAEAQGVGWLFAARGLQGIATGIAMGAISAALLDLQPPANPRLGALVGVAAPLGGLAAGALGAGLLVQYGPNPTRLIFWLLFAVFAVAIIVATAIPETVDRAGRPWAHALRPSVAVPGSMRVAFIATIPCLLASWALGGLILSLGPSLTAGVLGSTSHVAGGLPIFIMTGLSALASIWLRDTHARSTARGGLAALIAGVALALIGLEAGSLALFLLGTAAAGLGFGPAFAGAFRSLAGRAPVDQRAALVSAILVVSYLAFSLPAVAAGAAITQLGLHETADIYGIALIVIAAVALALSGQLEDPQTEAATARRRDALAATA
ncbi:MAG TPA: MFS transporter [Solirubrobacteraceae bacterium]|jgi:MFS family permease|nr:MFS transporter [Solirubrobacteraceae bacterium]